MANGGSSRSFGKLAAGVIALAVVTTGAWYAWRWEPRSHVPSEVAYWYKKLWTPGQIHPGWKLVSVTRDVDHPELLVHRVEVPAALAGDLVMIGSSERERLVSEIACPGRDHPVWARLARRHDVRIELQTERGVFSTVDCRAAVF